MANLLKFVIRFFEKKSKKIFLLKIFFFCLKIIWNVWSKKKFEKKNSADRYLRQGLKISNEKKKHLRLILNSLFFFRYLCPSLFIKNIQKKIKTFCWKKKNVAILILLPLPLLLLLLILRSLARLLGLRQQPYHLLVIIICINIPSISPVSNTINIYHNIHTNK